MIPSTRRELGELLRLASPIALAQFGLMMLGLVDVAFLGRVSVTDLGGASIGRSISFAATSIGLGIASALEPLASQAIGANELGRAWSSLLTILRALLLLWIPSVAFSYALTLLLPTLGVAPALAAPARAFLLAQAPSLFLFPAFFAIKSFLQAHRSTGPALVAAVVANVVNVAACGLLVRGDSALRFMGLPAVGLPALGALGAGLANSIANFVLCAIVFVAATRRAAPPSSTGPTLGRVLALGMPMGLQLAAEIGVFATIGVIAGLLGERAVSAHQIALSLASFTFMGAQGISSATAVRVGHAIGAGRSARSSGVLGLLLGAAYMTMTSLVFLAVPALLMGFFTDDREVLTIGVDLVRIAALFQIFDGIQSVAAGALRGAGDVKFPFWANLGAHWVIGFPTALALCFGLRLGPAGLWWGLLAGLAIAAVLLARRFVIVSRGPIARV